MEKISGGLNTTLIMLAGMGLEVSLSQETIAPTKAARA
jgi:hypothetical protein